MIRPRKPGPSRLCGPGIRGRQVERGQALYEFAMVVPLVLVIVVALFDVGRIVYINNTLAEAAREGARYGAVAGRADAARDEVAAFTRERLVAVPGASVTVVCENVVSKAGVCSTGDLIRVDVATSVAPITPIVGSFLGPLSLSSSARMTIHE